MRRARSSMSGPPHIPFSLKLARTMLGIRTMQLQRTAPAINVMRTCRSKRPPLVLLAAARARTHRMRNDANPVVQAAPLATILPLTTLQLQCLKHIRFPRLRSCRLQMVWLVILTAFNFS
jgi:hypothetical protein